MVVATRWTRGNGGEAVPGVATPLTAAFWRGAMESAMVEMFHRLGAVTTAEKRSGIFEGRIRFFYGRIASDFDLVLAILGRLPGVDPAALEQQLVGEAMGIAPMPAAWYQPVVAATKTALVLTTLGRTVDRRTVATRAWWRQSLARLEADDDPATARCLWAEAYARMPDDMAVQCLVAALHPAFAERLANLARRVTNDESTALAVISGADVEESEMLRELCGDVDLDRFLDRYGFYGPDEGELSSPVWREDPAALEKARAQYRQMSDGPLDRMARTRRETDAAITRVKANASPKDKLELAALLRVTRRFTPMREKGKTLMLLCLDVARASGRAVGKDLAGRGVIDDPEDVFYVTPDEFDATDLRVRVEGRKEQRRQHQRIYLPLTFREDELEEIVRRPHATTDARLSGLGVSPGIYRGRARVITDPQEAGAFEPGDVLVCGTTDPGWTLVLSLAGGVVLDMGSVLSHGAIVARELGVPCVANTGDGTTRIPDGALVEVDGVAGTVTILAVGPAG